MALSDKTSTRSASYVGTQVPDFPNISPVLADIPGFIEQDQRYQEWWDITRRQIILLSNNTIAVTDSLITQVSTSLQGKISVQSTPPVSPNINDLWVDTGDNNKAKYWDGTLWQYKQDLVLAAAISTEATTRATADGFLSAKYTLTVVAGNVVTGMNITSASGPGTNISEVTFQTDRFKIYNGTTGLTMFDVSGSDVRIGGTLIVNTTGQKMYIGTGTFAATNTPFYVDAAGNFSLKNNFSWTAATATLAIATDQKLIVTDNANYLTWQGSVGLNVPGIYLQHETGSGGGVNLLAVGTLANSAIFFTKSRGSFSAQSAVGSDDQIGSMAWQAYRGGGTWTSMATHRCGITFSTDTPYYFINVGGVSNPNYYWIFNYDGKLYFSDTSLNPINATPSSSLGAPYVSDTTANLYRPSIGTVKTDGNFTVAGTCTATTFSGSGTSLTGVLKSANNLSDLGSASTARSNLGVTSTGADTTYAFRSNNLSDLGSASTARSNLGVTATGADTTYAFRSNNLSDLGSASTARTNLGLQSMATQSASSVTITGGTLSGLTGITGASQGTCNVNGLTLQLNSGTTGVQIGCGEQGIGGSPTTEFVMYINGRAVAIQGRNA